MSEQGESCECRKVRPISVSSLRKEDKKIKKSFCFRSWKPGKEKKKRNYIKSLGWIADPSAE